ncbi:hypothetical protein TKK_0015722 [Trichogramma kaykai]
MNSSRLEDPSEIERRDGDPSGGERREDGAVVQGAAAEQLCGEFDAFKREILSLFREFIESQSGRNEVADPVNNSNNDSNINVASLSLNNNRNAPIPATNNTSSSVPSQRGSNIHVERRHRSSPDAAASAASVRYVSTESRLPQFWRTVPEQWFDVVEHYFSSRGISSDEDKYFTIILLDKFSENEEERLNHFAALSSIGSHSPAEFFNVLLAAGGDTFPRESILKVWKQRLPIDIRVQLGSPAVIANEASLLRRAEEIFTILKSSNRIAVDAIKSGSAADDKTEILLKHIQRLEFKLDSQSCSQSHKSRDRKSYAKKRYNRNNDRSRSATSKSDDVVICAAHAKYGANTYARSCKPPCNFDKNKSVKSKN